jgi:hypothetical protein
MRRTLPALGLFLPALALVAVAAADEPDTAKLEKQRCPKPSELALVFSLGYGSDLLPADDAKFGDLLRTVKDGGFNVVHGTCTEKRLELCKKHGVKLMVDLLAEPHVYKSPDRAQALCEKLRDNPDVWGYNVWNDTFAKTGEGRRRDVNNVRSWDPTHPAFCGTYRTIGMEHLTNADVLGYYDFPWKRGLNQHFPHLLAYSGWARERDAWFYAWLSATSGQPGKGNFNRCRWSANTSVAFGLKGVLWFLGSDLLNVDKLEWTDAGKDVVKVNQELLPLAGELAKLGNPTAVYATPVTRTPNDEPLPDGKKEAMPAGLEKNGFPKDFRAPPAGGEFVAGVFTDEGKRDVLFVANHNAYAAQRVVLKVAAGDKVGLFDRQTGKWQPVEVKDGAVSFPLAEGGGEMVRFGE